MRRTSDALPFPDSVAIVVFLHHTEYIRREAGEPYGIQGLETQVMASGDDA